MLSTKAVWIAACTESVNGTSDTCGGEPKAAITYSGNGAGDSARTGTDAATSPKAMAVHRIDERRIEQVGIFIDSTFLQRRENWSLQGLSGQTTQPANHV